MTEKLNGFEILEFIELPENAQFTDFYKNVQEYYNHYGLNNLFNIKDLFNLYRDWVLFMDKNPITTRMHKKLFEMIKELGFNLLDTYIISDILLLNINKINFIHLVEEDKLYIRDALRNEIDALSDQIPRLRLIEMIDIVDKLKNKTYSAQVDILNIYLLQFYHGIKKSPENQDYFEKLIRLNISSLKERFGDVTTKGRAEIIIEEINNKKILHVNKITKSTESVVTIENKTEIEEVEINKKHSAPTFGENEKMSVKDVAAVLHCSPSHVRRLIQRKINPLIPYRDSPKGRMYFFYPEVVDWMKSSKQLGFFEEAGEVFRRKPRGGGKKQRPKLE